MYRFAACLLMVSCGRIAFEARDDAAAEDAPTTALGVTPPPFMTTSMQFVDVPGSTITVPPSPGQRWLLLVNATLESTALDWRGPEARYLVDGVERGIGGTESVAPGQPGPWQSMYMFDGGVAPTTIVFQARDGVGQTTTLDHFSAVVVPLSPEADPIYRSLDAVTPVATIALADVVSFTLTPTMPGDDYLVLLSATATESPGTSNITLQWFDPEGAPWTSELQNPRGAWQSHLLVRRTTLQGPTVIKIEGRSGTTASVQHIRVVALRIAGLASFAEKIDRTLGTTTSLTPVLANELLPSLLPAPQYLVLGTMQLDDDCSNAMLNGRRAQFSVDAQRLAVSFFASNCAYQTTQGYLGLQQTAPTSVTASYGSATGENMGYVESALFVVGVP